MDLSLARYVTYYYSEFFTPTERLAHRHLVTTYKMTGGRSDEMAQAEVGRMSVLRARWLSRDPKVLQLASGGLDAFVVETAGRILREHRAQVFLNYCPQCGGLTRTLKAKLCLHCGQNWHRAAAL